MTQNLITSAFELVRDVEHGVLLLDTFHRLATREVSPPCLLSPSLVLLCFPSVPHELSRHHPASIMLFPVSLIAMVSFLPSVPLVSRSLRV